MEKDVFDYLDKNYRYLHNYIRQIDYSLFNYPHSVIIKGRTFIENLTQEVAKLKGYGLLNRMTQAERLRKLKDDEVFDDSIYLLFNTTRILGNRATHAKVEGDLEVALNIHKNIYKITCWFVITYIDPTFEPDPYKCPVPALNKSSDINTEMISNLIEKTERDDQNDEEENQGFNVEEISCDEKEESEDIFEDLMIESIIGNKELDKKCLVQELTRLKVSPKEAIKEMGEFSPFKRYMHIERDPEKELEELIAGDNDLNYVKSVITKITNSSELNIFYSSYTKNCINCSNCNCCPIKANYELLSKENVQESIADLLAQCIIKNKIAISTRELLNFMYELIIHKPYIDIKSPILKNNISKLNNLDYIKSLMPNIIFNHKQLSLTFKTLNNLDPLNIKNENVDDFIIKFNNSTDILSYFKEYIDYPKGYIDKLNDMDFTATEDKKIRHELLDLFIRSYYVCGKGDLFSLGEKSKLENLCDDEEDRIIK